MSLYEDFWAGGYFDTDDLKQPEYHYFRKALDLAKSLPKEDFRVSNQFRSVASGILRGRISAHKIETDPQYEWLRDD